MMVEEFLVFQKFQNKEQANALTELLKRNNILVSLEDTKRDFDVSFANNDLENEYVVKIRKEDFQIANELFNALGKEQSDSINKDYFLYDFTDEELIEVVEKPDEWGNMNYQLALKILSDRGKNIDSETIEKYNEKRIKELSKPEKYSRHWVFTGYLLACMGGLLGLLIGWELANIKKTLPNGNRVYAYSLEDRKHGGRIFFISITVIVIEILVMVVAVFSLG